MSSVRTPLFHVKEKFLFNSDFFLCSEIIWPYCDLESTYLLNNSSVRQEDHLARFFHSPQAYEFQNFLTRLFGTSFFYFWRAEQDLHTHTHRETNQGKCFIILQWEPSYNPLNLYSNPLVLDQAHTKHCFCSSACFSWQPGLHKNAWENPLSLA